MGAAPYDPRRYWQSTLDGSADEAGTAYPWLPVGVNRALYRRWTQQMRSVLAAHDVSARGRAVLDVGAGVGFMLDIWRSQEPAELTAIDFASAAVEQLTRRFPDVSVDLADIGDPTAPFTRVFDLVSAANVLLHVVDGGRFANALANIAAMLRDGGVFVAIEPVTTHTYRLAGGGNSAARTRAEWRAALAAAGLRLDATHPLTALLANPADTRLRSEYRLLELHWRAFERLSCRVPRAAVAYARMVTPLDRGLCSLGYAPSSKVLVAHRVSRA